MAKRKRDNRYITQALPPLVRLKGEPANRKLCLAVRLEHCDKCDASPLVTTTTPGEGTIVRLCTEHFYAAKRSEYEQEQHEQQLEFVRAQLNSEAWWHKVS